MVTTNDEKLYHMLDSIRNHGRPDSTLGQYEHIRFGLNLRITDLGSAIGRVQLQKLPVFNQKREQNANRFLKELKNVQGIILPSYPEEFHHVWHQFTIRSTNRESLSAFLKNQRIETRTYYPRLIQDYPHLEQNRVHCKVAEKVVSEVISLPVHPGLSTKEVEHIINSVTQWSINFFSKT